MILFLSRFIFYFMMDWYFRLPALLTSGAKMRYHDYKQNMKKYLLLALISLVAPLSVQANAELVQIVAFNWNETATKLEVISFGSGTAIRNDLVITNKHVVKVNDEVADFLLFCPGQPQTNRAVQCNVAAGVSALHPQMDMALVKTLDKNTFLPTVRTSTSIRSLGDLVRVVGFPVPDDSEAQNFGSTKTLKAFEAWMKDPSAGFNFKGDKPTTTRGRVLARFKLQNTGELFTQTDARVNFGNSGGAAFDQYGNYIGIPTLKDTLGRSYILEYGQMHDWVQERLDRPARYETAAYNYYKSLQRSKAGKTATSVTRNASARLRYYQKLRERRQQKLQQRSSQNSVSSRQNTTSRYTNYNRGYQVFPTR